MRKVRIMARQEQNGGKNIILTKMTRNFGVSTSLCAGEVGRFLKGVDLPSPEDWTIGYLRILDDFTQFARQNGFEMVEIELGFSLINANSLFPVARELKQKISPFRIVCGHLPLGEINISALHPDIRREAIAETKRCIDLCQELEINKLVMHPGCFTTVPDRYLLLAHQTRRIAEESILEIFGYCRERDIELSLENLHRNEPLFQRPEEFEPFVQKGIGIVLDTVHAFVSGIDPLDFIAKVGNKITEVHLTDGIKSKPVSHYALGTGEVNCLSVLQKLAEIDFEGRIILEVESKEALLKSKKFLKETGYLAD